MLQPVDVSVSRSLTSSYDATVAEPGIGLQLGLGGVGAFREIDGRRATAAGLVNRVTVTNTLALPFGLTVANRLEAADTRTWWRRSFANAQAEGQGDQRTVPDLTVRWSWRPAWAAGVVSNVGASARLLRQEQTARAPADSGAPADVRVTDVTSYPVSGTVTWSLLGGLTTAGGVNLVRRSDELPGSRTGSTTRDANLELARAFHPPKRWGLRSDIRARAGFQRSRTRAVITPLAFGDAPADLPDASPFARLVQADQGRQSINFSANSEVAETLTLSLTGAHVVNFNQNLNQRFSQTVFSAVLQVNFFSGAMR
jgi:hypothetical protein